MNKKFNELFLKAFDSDVRIIDDYGEFTEGSGLEEYENVLYGDSPVDTMSSELVSHGEHHVEYEVVIKVSDRYFMAEYAAGGKDLDEILDTVDFVEVYPRQVTTTAYVR